MNRLPRRLVSSQHKLLILTLALFLIGTGLLYSGLSYGATLPARSIQLSDSLPSATATYRVGFTIPASETLGSIQLQFCANDPIINDPCITPTGFDISSAVLSSQTGETGFSISPATTAHVLILTRTAALAATIPVSYTLDHVTNASAPGSYYVRVQTFASTDASGADTDEGGLAFSIANAIQISAVVPPYLFFCSGVAISAFDCSTASGNYINFGNFSAITTSSAQTQMVIATNAGNGYTITYAGNTLTSGNNTIAPLNTADVSRPGVSQFGLNMVANQDPAIGVNSQGPGAGSVAPGYAQANVYKFFTNDLLASSSVPSDYTKFTVSYIANVATSQSAGVYASTLTYVALANF